MANDDLGETSRELFSQFLYRISVEFKNRNAFLGLFSTIKYLNSNNDERLREKVFKYKFERGFIFSSEHFKGSKGKFPIGFLVWNLSKDVSINNQKIELDVYNEHCEKIGTKEIATTSRNDFLANWVPRYRNTKTLPPLSSAINISTRTKDVRDRVTDDFLCSMMCCGNDMQHQNQVSLLSGPQGSAGSFSVTPNNFERAMVMHAVRKLPKADWTNNRDQFYQPYQDNLPSEFVSDCVVWSAFALSNNSASLKDVQYNGKTYQLDNHLFPFSLSEVRSWNCALSDIRAQLFTANEDRFMASWLESAELSEEGTAVLNAARELYKCVYENLDKIRWLDYKIELWDIGWWQIKEAAKQLDIALPYFANLKQALGFLSRKIDSQISEFGFLPPCVKPLE